MVAPVVLSSLCTATAVASTTFTPVLPAWDIGDLAVVCLGVRSNASNPPSGPLLWTDLTGDNQDTTSGLISYKILEAGDVNPVFTTTTSGTWAAVAFIVDAGTFDPANPIDSFVINLGWNTGLSATSIAASITTTVADVLAIAAQMNERGQDVTLLTPTWSDLLANCNPGAGGANIGVSVAEKDISVPGATGSVSWQIPATRDWVAGQIGIKPSSGTGPTGLDIDDLIHVHPVDAADVGGNYTIVIANPVHAHPVDQAAVSEVGVAEVLDIDNTSHAHPVDSPLLVPLYLLGTDDLSHGQTLDEVTLGLPVIVMDIDSPVHAHPVDEAAVYADYPLTPNNLSHAHPVDSPVLGVMEGDYTALIAETDRWSANAGAELNSAQGVDLNWHVIEIVFDGTNTVLAVDGVEVTGDAGARALSSILVGAEMGGVNRFQGSIGELRIYDGAMTAADRLETRNELTTKWITG